MTTIMVPPISRTLSKLAAVAIEVKVLPEPRLWYNKNPRDLINGFVGFT